MNSKSTERSNKFPNRSDDPTASSKETLSRINAVTKELQAKGLTEPELLEFCAMTCVVAEDLQAKIKCLEALRRKESGAAPIIQALAASEGAGWEMLNIVQTCLDELSPGNPTLLALKQILINAHKDSRSSIARKAAVASHAKSPKKVAKDIVQDCWRTWQLVAPDSYKSTADFGRAMLDKFPDELKSQATIGLWARRWKLEMKTASC